MTRRALGRGRSLIALGSLLSLLGILPAWWRIARTNAEALSGNGLEGVGIVVFLAALALLAVITLPYATRDGDSALDRPAAYVLLAGIAVAAFLFRIYEISTFHALGLPLEAPGLWLTGSGLSLIVWGVGEVLTDRPPQY
jgi:hypothetical protein